MRFRGGAPRLMKAKMSVISRGVNSDELAKTWLSGNGDEIAAAENPCNSTRYKNIESFI